ncbi:MAG: BLUF domain-containing protein [Polaromonas sp.]|nr:BLUF domain-containing protein [Polaromonas sp.]
MIRLIYASRARQALPLDLKDILAVSRRKNLKANITGALCFLDGVYLQYLEGETFGLEDLYRKIIKDPRHSDARLLERKKITERLFNSWSMALVTWDDQTRAIFEAFNGQIQPDLHAIDPLNAAVTFEALARSSNWLEVGKPN